jgi:hypothetical protein
LGRWNKNNKVGIYLKGGLMEMAKVPPPLFDEIIVKRQKD